MYKRKNIHPQQAVAVALKSSVLFGYLKRWYVAIFLCCLFVAFLLPSVAWAADFVTTDNSATFTVIQEVTIENPTAADIKNLRITVPLPGLAEVAWQKNVGEDFSPKPQKFTTDSNGNRFGEYEISNLPAHSTKILRHSFSVQNFTATYSIAGEAMNMADYVGVPVAYLQPEQDIESNDTTIISYAKTLMQGDNNPYIIAKRIFMDINLFMTYDNSPKASRSAKAALSSGRGNCVDYANLYIACLRSVGIPARMCSGYWYNSSTDVGKEFFNQDGFLKGELLKHTWVEFYLPNQGWVVADPTFTYNVQLGGKLEKMVDWDRFANISKKNRLIFTGFGNADNLKLNYTYEGNKPQVSLSTKLALYSTVLPYQDLADHWAAESVMNLRYWNVPVVKGISDKLYGVNLGITRAELVTMLNRILDSTDPLSERQLVDMGFKDMTSSYWAYNEVTKAVSRGLVRGFPDGTFQPNKVVDRAEMASILAKVGNLQKLGKSPFTDLDLPGYLWAKDSIIALYNAGLASGITADKFAPDQTLTRGEAAVFIDRWLKSDYY